MCAVYLYVYELGTILPIVLYDLCKRLATLNAAVFSECSNMENPSKLLLVCLNILLFEKRVVIVNHEIKPHE